MLNDLFDLFFSVLNALPGINWFICIMAVASFYGLVGLFKMIFTE